MSIETTEPGAEVIPDLDSQEFWDRAATGATTFSYQVCDSCGNQQFPPLALCRRCHAEELTWSDAPLDAVVRSWITVNHPIYPYLVDAVPYRVVLAEAAPHLRVLARWRSDVEPSLGLPVELAIGPGEAGPMPVAEPKADAS